MQDHRSGDMVPLADALRPDGPDFIPEAERGPVFRIGEVLEIRGGRFRVQAMGRRFIRLEGLPGTRVKQEAQP